MYGTFCSKENCFASFLYFLPPSSIHFLSISKTNFRNCTKITRTYTRPCRKFKLFFKAFIFHEAIQTKFLFYCCKVAHCNALYKNVKTRLFWSLDLIGPFMIHVLMPFMTQNFMGLLSYIYKHEVEHGPGVFSYVLCWRN